MLLSINVLCHPGAGSTLDLSNTELPKGYELRVGEMVTHLAHNQEIVGSIPTPATRV